MIDLLDIGFIGNICIFKGSIKALSQSVPSGTSTRKQSLTWLIAFLVRTGVENRVSRWIKVYSNIRMLCELNRCSFKPFKVMGTFLECSHSLCYTVYNKH